MKKNNKKEDVNIFIKPIFDKKYKHYLPSYIELKRLLRMIKKTSPDFNMMMEIYNFIKLLEEIYMYGNDSSHNLFSARVPKGYDAAMIYAENNFEIKFVLGKSIDNDNEINIQTRRTTRSSGERTKSLKFNEGENIIHSKEDEQSLLFIISCLMNGVAELVTYYYNNKKL